MTYTELCISCGTVILLLIGWLMQYLEGKFQQIAFQARVDEYLSKDQIFYNYTDGIMVKPAQPKRRKYRDNK